MAEVVNLNKARKVKARIAAKAQAAENRVRFGRSLASKSARDAEAEKAARLLDGARLEDPKT